MADITPFLFEDHPVRTIVQNGQPWFIATDICRCLEIKQATRAVENLDEDEKGVSSTHTPGGPQEVVIVSESGLYALILRSRKAVTPGTVQHRFRKWITGEVIPAIRKTGGYGTPAQGSAGPLGRDLIEILTHAVAEQRAMTAREHRARFTRILIAETSLSDREIADRLGDILNDHMPEYVAYHRRKLAEENA